MIDLPFSRHPRMFSTEFSFAEKVGGKEAGKRSKQNFSRLSIFVNKVPRYETVRRKKVKAKSIKTKRSGMVGARTSHCKT